MPPQERPRRGNPPTDSAPAGAAALDLRGPGLRLLLCGPTPRKIALPDAAADIGGGLLLGRAAADALAAAPASGWDRLIDRVGDPTPCRLGPRSASAAELIAAIVSRATGPLAELVVVPPPQWRAHRRQALSNALTAVGLPAPRFVPDLQLVLGPCPDDARDEVLLVAVGASATQVRRVAASPAGWRVAGGAEVPFGLDDVDDAILAFVRERAGEARVAALSGEERGGLRRACADARERLALVPAVDVLAPGLPPVRLVRTDLDGLLGAPLEEALAALPEGVLTVADPGRAVLTGTGLPLVVQTLSARVGRPIELVDAEADAAAFARAGAGPAAPPLCAADGPLPRRARHQHRHLLLAVAASTAVVTGVTLGTPALREAVIALALPAGAAAPAQAAPRAASLLESAPPIAPAPAAGWVMPGAPGPVVSGAAPAPAGTAPTSASASPATAATRSLLPIAAAAGRLGGLVAAPGSLTPTVTGSPTGATRTPTQGSTPTATSQPGVMPTVPASGTTPPETTTPPGTTSPEPTTPGPTSGEPDTPTPSTAPSTPPTTTEPTQEPTTGPTQEPTTEPTQEPTQEPTTEPTQEPTTEPTQEPTTEPTQEPTQGAIE